MKKRNSLQLLVKYRPDVGLISASVSPTARTDLDSRPDRGRPTEPMVGGPLWRCRYKVVGAGGTHYEVHRCAPGTPPTPLPI